MTRIAPWGLLLAVASAAARGGEPEVPIGPYLQALLQDSVWVLWETRPAGIGGVRYRAGDGAEVTVEEAVPGERHRVRLAGLSPDTVHGYQILLDGAALDGPFRFRTSPPAGTGTVRFAVTGDSGSADANQMAVAEVIRGMRPDLFLHAGDMSYKANLALTVFEPYRDILANAGFYPTMGNHDLFFVPRDYFIPPSEDPEGIGTYYSFDWASAHFIALDSNWLTFRPEGPQVDWLVADLERAKASGARWLILVFHECVYTVGGYALDRRRTREVIPPIADRFGVDLVITGHDHDYQRTHPVLEDAVRDAWHDPEYVSPRGTIYVVTGGGGGILYPRVGGIDEPLTRVFASRFHAVEVEVAPEVLSLRAVEPGGTVLDAFTIRKDLPRPELRFVRGDADLSGEVQLTDAVQILEHLFLGRALECPAIADPVASGGELNIVDPIYLLNFLFLGGPAPAAPFPECGSDPGLDPGPCLRAGCR